MADELDDDLLQNDPKANTPTPTVETTEETPAAPQHSPLALHGAQELGIDPSGLSPEALQAAILTIRRREASKQKPAEPVEEPDEPLDYGVTLDGKPIANEAQFLEEYNPAQLRSLKLAHQAVVENKKLRKEHESLKQERARELAERNQRAILKQFHTAMKERKDLFGENPGQAKPGTPEHAKYQMAMAHVNTLTREQITNPLDDMRATIGLFAPAAEPAPTPGGKTRQDYINAQLVRPTQRRPADTRTRLERRTEEIAAQQEANGHHLGLGDDDDADLLD